jgi:hypothetical protein
MVKQGGMEQAGMDRLHGVAYGDHYFLEPADECWYLGEYACSRRTSADRALIGGLIRQLKWQCPEAARHGILRDLAGRLRGALDRQWVEDSTWIPVPSSRVGHHADDRRGADELGGLLRLAFAGYDLDLRAALALRTDGIADRWRPHRLSVPDLRLRLQADAHLLRSTPLRRRIVVFDDVLTSGKHYYCARQCLLESLADRPVCGLFLARRLPRREPGRTAPRGRVSADR